MAALIRKYLAVFTSLLTLVFVVIAMPGTWSTFSGFHIEGAYSYDYKSTFGLFRAKQILHEWGNGYDYTYIETMDSDGVCKSSTCSNLVRASQVFVVLSCSFALISFVLLALQTLKLISLGSAKLQRILFISLSVLTSVSSLAAFVLWIEFLKYNPGTNLWNLPGAFSYNSSFTFTITAFVLSFVNCVVVVFIHHIEDAISNYPCCRGPTYLRCRSSQGSLIASLAMLAVGSLLLMIASGLDSWSLVKVTTNTASDTSGAYAVGPFALKGGSDGSRQSPTDYCGDDSQCYSEMSTVEAFLILAILMSAFPFISQVVLLWLASRPSRTNVPRSTFPKVHGAFALASSALALIAVMVWHDVSGYLWNKYVSIPVRGYSANFHYTFGVGFAVAVVGLSLTCFAGICLLLWIPGEKGTLPFSSGLVDPLTSSYSFLPNTTSPNINPPYVATTINQQNNIADSSDPASAALPTIPPHQFCGYCGYSMPLDHRFCRKCGRQAT